MITSSSTDTLFRTVYNVSLTPTELRSTINGSFPASKRMMRTYWKWCWLIHLEWWRSVELEIRPHWLWWLQTHLHQIPLTFLIKSPLDRAMVCGTGDSQTMNASLAVKETQQSEESPFLLHSLLKNIWWDRYWYRSIEYVTMLPRLVIWNTYWPSSHILIIFQINIDRHSHR